jgi:hypothetical protein
LKGFALEHVPYKIYEHLNNMWEAIEYANVISFPQQVDIALAAGDDQLASDLYVGWTKNDVLMKMVSLRLDPSISLFITRVARRRHRPINCLRFVRSRT